jgi:hypothetical protein
MSSGSTSSDIATMNIDRENPLQSIGPMSIKNNLSGIHFIGDTPLGKVSSRVHSLGIHPVSDQIIHSEICLKNDASSCGGLLTALPRSKNRYESTIGKFSISRCQSTIQACKTDSPWFKKLIFSKAVFIKKYALSPAHWFGNMLVSC